LQKGDEFMRMILGAVALMAVCNAAQASPITYTLTGDLTGTLDGAAITNAAFVWQLTGDTNDEVTLITPPPPPSVPAIPALTDTITIGALVLTPTIPTYFAWASVPFPSPFGIGGFSNSDTTLGLAWQTAALFGYDGTSSIGPLSVAFDNAGPLPTNGGSLDITATSDLVFSAVDEPPALALLLVGLGALGWLALKRRADAV
jgi:hypothetical protein